MAQLVARVVRDDEAAGSSPVTPTKDFGFRIDDFGFEITYLYWKLFEMDHTKFITRNPQIMLGKPVIKGTRITVELIVRKLAGGYSTDDLLASYPHLTREQVFAALEYAADLIANEEIIEMT